MIVILFLSLSFSKQNLQKSLTEIPSDLWTVRDEKGNFCILFQARVNLTDHNGNSVIFNPINSTTLGSSCDRKDQKLVLSTKGSNLTFYGTLVDDYYYYVEMVIFYHSDKRYENSNLKLFQTNQNNYFRCQSVMSLNLTLWTLEMDQLWVQMYRDDPSINFEGQVRECLADISKKNKTPIILGSVVILVMGISFVVFMLVRRNKRVTYESF